MNQAPIFAGRANAAVTPQPKMTSAQIDFLSQLATHLGLPPSDGEALVPPRFFTGPAGLACRLHLHHGEAAVLPEALLPISAAELMGPQVERLLLVQGAVLSEFGWHLGVSPEGLLQLSCMTWIDSPYDAATALDLANGVGIAVMQSLLRDDSVDAPPAVQH
ncbi:hypothetical protein [Rhizobacter sp. Root1221]|uniref:hypothetical protein n=1 Tax=Rhizobacter sp. Root1221 TaxID=1736433 RepID=UPI0006F4B2AB|nr:hypothetical protein [Rhizobacter sp. Root1221]KQV95762.1 hypothetical protein ASC87_04200 [Rhizobacter sp. Root1221]